MTLDELISANEERYAWLLNGGACEHDMTVCEQTVDALKELRCYRRTMARVAKGPDKYGTYEWCPYCENYSDCEDWHPLDGDCKKFGYKAIEEWAKDGLVDEAYGDDA